MGHGYGPEERPTTARYLDASGDRVREYSSPPLATISAAATLSDAVVKHGLESPDAVLFRIRPDTGSTAGIGWAPVTAAEFLARVDRLARGLVAGGFRPGQRIGVLSRTRYEWTLVDYALWHAGLVTVPIYESSSEEQVGWILGDSQAVAVIVENERHQATVEGVRHLLPDLGPVWVIDDGALAVLEAAGDADAAAAAGLAKSRTGLDAASLATIVYTSGTTGRPKGCALTHHNLLFAATSAVLGLPALFTEETTALLFLPLAHVLARQIQVALMIAKVPIGHCPDTRNLAEDLAAFRPTLLLAVPSVFEKLYSVAQQKAADQGHDRIFGYATTVAIKASQAQQAGRVPASTRVLRALFDKLVFRKLRAALGGEVAWVISGGAPLGTRLGHFFRGAGTPVLEGWGLTETTSAASFNRPDAARIGTVGQPVAGTTIRVAEDGELLVRGENVFSGYWADPAGTATVLDGEGWFHSGDLGSIDDNGFVSITGRKKEILVTAGGKNVSPAVLEDRLRGHPLISQCMVVGDKRPYIACLITIDDAALTAWKTKVGRESTLGIEQLRDDTELIAEVQAAVDDANRAVSRAEAIRRFRILPVDFTEAGGQLTPTLKVRRSVVLQQFTADIEALYPASGAAPEMRP
jgi:long-chain acyl-CoA synthetase